MNKIAGKSLYL